MKKFTILSILIFTSSFGFAQVLTEVSNISIFEHHFSGCTPCEPAGFGDSSAYDFVTHQHINGVLPIPYDINRDMVEHNGDSQGPAPFGFTSDSSSVAGGVFGGNGTTKYHLVSGFDYVNATEWSVVNAYNSSIASTDVEVVQIGEIYLGKIRNLDYYVVIRITDYQSITDNDFVFDYKYTDNPVSTNSIDENDAITSLAVYPNPAGNAINIQLDKTYNDITISIVNLFGSQVFSEQFNDRDLINLNLEKLSNGVYIILSETDGKHTQLKFVKED
ncbi:MAG: hypothetical protein ACJASQ_001275 [Crocinitomicaceae bacterium]|jgi:hypothetical protein